MLKFKRFSQLPVVERASVLIVGRGGFFQLVQQNVVSALLLFVLTAGVLWNGFSSYHPYLKGLLMFAVALILGLSFVFP